MFTEKLLAVVVFVGMFAILAILVRMVYKIIRNKTLSI